MTQATVTRATAPSLLRRWLAIVVACLFLLLAAVNLWGQLRFTVAGVAMTGRVVEFHHASGCRNACATVEAQVEVTGPSDSKFRASVDDTWAVFDWDDNTAVPLLCLPTPADSGPCVLDSWRDRWLFPLMLVIVGGAVMAWPMWLTYMRRGR